MSIDERKIRAQLKTKDKEISELKELLAEAEAEIKELNNFRSLQRPRPGILESRFLNKLIKGMAFLVICLIIVFIGIYPWLNKDKFFGGGEDTGEEVVSDVIEPSEEQGEGETGEEDGEPAPTPDEDVPTEERDIFQPTKKMLEVDSDLGWLNVRTEPDVETGQIIKKINSGDEYEWLEKTDENWYKIVIDEAGHTGFVSGEYVIIK